MALKSLRQRLFLMILLPVGLLLFLVGVFGFIYMRGTLFEEWQDASIVKLQRAAHQIDMRLGQINDWIQMFHKTADTLGGPLVQTWIVQQLRDMKGVTHAELKWKDNDGAQATAMRRGGSGMGGGRMMRFHRAKITEVTPPSYNAQTGQETVRIISQLKDESEAVVGTLEVTVSFNYLLEGIKAFAWWQTDQACLIDDHGRYLAHTEAIMKGRKRFGELDDLFELSLLRAINEKPFGTVLGPGKPPDQVGGFYRLKYAPWTIVLFAPGEKVLAPIIQFRNYYFAGGILAIFLILMMIRSVVGRMVGAFTEISSAAEKVAKGDYGKPIPVHGQDEIAQLTKSFNSMVEGLKERDFVTNTFGRYVDQEIAEKLMKLPEASRLGGEKRDVAILMSDIRGFTPLSETLSPDVIISFLNRYFSRLIEVVQKHQGIIVDFFGDSVLVFFDPLKGPVEPVIRASVECALDMVSAMEIFNSEMRMDDLPELQTGIGVNSGEVIVGNIGSETRAKYGIVGSPVNITQRIQSTAKGGEVVISETVYRQLSEEVIIGRPFSMPLKGVREKMNLYVVKAIQG
ncbi:MAG: HAMP domain-containing protein [Desulfobacteraceae bacterium]|uniref:HAMP domain-containing protein n=1 Tax=Candidatus Desulfacyla euxinica TaxID=2841693 RepID=A0A8J6MYS4_9DELT|nr:HAMP domain-containing protein [Candidatus Desulfacyla euxinica]MBL6978892.1 HAMP domain-containing protein [Desulfobacteraceae bacterium]